MSVVGTPIVLSTLSAEYVEVPIIARDDASDPTADVVKMAFMVGVAKPAGGDWVTGSWRTGLSGTHYARAMVGPGFKVLGPGKYIIWVTFVDNPEVPAREAGYLTIV